MGSKCRLCETVYFPPKSVCPKCKKEKSLMEQPLSTRGRIYSFTYCAVAPSDVNSPYILALVEFPEGPRVPGIVQIENPSPDSVQIGEEVKIVIGKVGIDEDGLEIEGYMFKPLRARC